MSTSINPSDPARLLRAEIAELKSRLADCERGRQYIDNPIGDDAQAIELARLLDWYFSLPDSDPDDIDKLTPRMIVNDILTSLPIGAEDALARSLVNFDD